MVNYRDMPGSKRTVTITSVRKSNVSAYGSDGYGAEYLIDLSQPVGIFNVMPMVGEYWSITKASEFWILDSRLAYQNPNLNSGLKSGDVVYRNKKSTVTIEDSRGDWGDKISSLQSETHIFQSIEAGFTIAEDNPPTVRSVNGTVFWSGEFTMEGTSGVWKPVINPQDIPEHLRPSYLVRGQSMAHTSLEVIAGLHLTDENGLRAIRGAEATATISLNSLIYPLRSLIER